MRVFLSKIQILNLILLGSAASVSPGALGNGEGRIQACRICPQVREVALILTASRPGATVPEDLEMAGVSGWGTSLRFDGLPTRHHYVSAPEDIRRVLSEMARRCERVKVLKTYSHGSTGRLNFGEGALSVLNAESVLGGGLDCVMAPDAAIEFNACNTGRGCRGEDFLREIARLLLPKGGSVRAATFYAGSFLGLTPMLPLNLDYQTLTVDEGFESVAWDNAPRSADACAANIESAVRAYSVLRRRAAGCGVDVGAVEREIAGGPLARIYGKALAEELALDELGGDRHGFAPERAGSARVLLQAMDALALARDRIVHRMEARGCGFRACTGGV